MTPCYVVFIGRVPGMYFTWQECSRQVLGLSGDVFRKYGSVEEAEETIRIFIGVAA